jgi:hypothetical protein
MSKLQTLWDAALALVLFPALCLLIAAAPLLVPGCSSSAITTAYNTEASVDATVTAAWGLWKAYEKASPQSAATVAAVDAAFQKVQLAEETAIAASISLASGSTNLAAESTIDLTDVNAALSDLTKLLASFGVKI